MKNRINLGFFVSAVACAVILHAVSLYDLKFALTRVVPLLQGDIRFRDAVTEKCASLSSPTATYTEKFLTERYPIATADGERGDCVLLAQSTHATRYYLRDFWNFQVQVRNADGVPLVDRHFAVDFPRPLVFLPFVLLLLALIFEFRPWGLAATMASYVFLASGGSLIATVRNLALGARKVVTDEQSWIALGLILFWVALCRGRRTAAKKLPLPSKEGRWLNRAMLSGIGLWNPAVFTLGGRLLLPSQGSLQRVKPFFNVQVVAVCLSVYLLALGTDGVATFFSTSLWMPRYFTFSALLFVALHQGKMPKEPVVWNLPGFWRSVLFVVAVEAHAYGTHFWEGTSHLTRIGAALVASQLVWPVRMDWRRVGRDIRAWSLPLAAAALLTTLSTQLAITDLIVFALNPLMHPTGTALFTFLAGLGLGFVTGNFAVAFFTLFTALGKASAVPVVQSALLDGIVAGMLLSPVSVLNLIPAAQFRLSAKAVIVHRFRQLAFPLGIGMLIYAVSAITSVAILRPATFVFLCLVAVVFQLKRSSWKFGNYTISLSSHNGGH